MACEIVAARWSQVLPFGYSETVITLIWSFSSERTERLAKSKVDGELLGQDAAGLQDDNSNSDDSKVDWWFFEWLAR